MPTKTRNHAFRRDLTTSNITWLSNTSTVTNTSSSSVSTAMQDTFTGDSLPKWRARIRAVTDATTPASGNRQRAKAVPHYVFCRGAANTFDVKSDDPSWYSYQRSGWERRALSVVIPPWSDVVNQNMTSADNRAISKLYSQLQGFQSSVSSGEDIGELSSTIKMLRSPMASARKLLTGLIERHQGAFSRRTPLSIAKALGDTALEYRFGIKPIVGTLAGGLVGLQNRDYLAHYYPFHATGEDETASVNSYVNGSGFLYWNERTLSKQTKSVRYQGVWAVGANVPKRSVQDVLRLRLVDVVPTIWNLIPYSWLVDYFTNVGTIAESIAVPWGGVRWCCKTTRYSDYRETRSVSQVTSLPRIYGTSFQPGITYAEQVSFVRSSVSSLPVPSLEFNPQLSGQRLLNIAALLATKIPVVGSMVKQAVERHPTLPAVFDGEMGRRGIRIPYPFHNKRP